MRASGLLVLFTWVVTLNTTSRYYCPLAPQLLSYLQILLWGQRNPWLQSEKIQPSTPIPFHSNPSKITNPPSGEVTDCNSARILEQRISYSARAFLIISANFRAPPITTSSNSVAPPRAVELLTLLQLRWIPKSKAGGEDTLGRRAQKQA